MTKTEMIRDVCRNNIGITNNTIKELVRTKYSTTVESNLIIAAVGSEKKRQVLAHTSGHLKRKAKELIQQAGDYKAARNILAMANGEL